MNKPSLVKKQNLENFYPRRKRTGHYKNFSFGSGFALFMEPTQQAAGYSASQNKHIYFMMIASLLGLAASRGQFNRRFFILLPANILTVSFVILSAIITFFLINLNPNWTLFLMVGLSLIFIIPSVLNFKKGAAHRPTLGLFRKPIERTIALTHSLVSYCPG